MIPPPDYDVAIENGSSQDVATTGMEAVVTPEQRCIVSIGSPFDQLVNLVHNKLPQELKDLIEDMVLEELLCPGYIFPWKHDGNVIWEGTMYQAARPEYLTLSRQIYLEYEIRLQTENTYVLGVEDPEGAQFFPPAKDRPFIRKAHISFDLLELDPDEGSYDYWASNAPPCRDNANCGWCLDYGYTRDARLMKKSRYITAMQVEELTLDLRGCRASWKRDEASMLGRKNYWELDGVALGMCSRYFRFDRGLPATLRVKASNGVDEQKVVQAIHDNNQPLEERVFSVSYTW
ncbi:MAG: hypothetical protein Q9169_005206 [Polycauliona sp. 2 TL-2023]